MVCYTAKDNWYKSLGGVTVKKIEFRNSQRGKITNRNTKKLGYKLGIELGSKQQASLTR